MDSPSSGLLSRHGIGPIMTIKFAADPMIVPLDRRKIPRDTIKSLADARESSIQVAEKIVKTQDA